MRGRSITRKGFSGRSNVCGNKDFSLFFGGVSHFIIGGMPDALCLIACVVFTLVWSLIAAKIANKVSAVILNRVVGAVLIATSLVMLAVNYLF